MEAIKLDAKIWEKIPLASNRGFNPMVHLTEVIEKTFPGFTAGFFSEDDLEARRVTEGYVILTPVHWADHSEYNEKVALRFGLTEKNGGLTWRGLYICVRPKDWGERRRRQIMKESEDRFAIAGNAKAREVASEATKNRAGRLDTGSAFSEVHTPAPPESYVADSSWEGKEASQEIYEGATAPSTPAAPARPRGRPKKAA